MIPNRIKRLGQLIAKNVSEVFMFEMEDPRIKLVSVTDVEVAHDLATAKVFVSMMRDDADERELIVARLNRAAGFVRARITEKMVIKRVPTLKFFLDNSIERGVRVCALIEKVRSEDEKISGGPEREEIKQTGGAEQRAEEENNGGE
jgi:ribosome-binding factor A